jgi:hypothetical protein
MSSFMTNDHFCKEMLPILKTLYNNVCMFYGIIKIRSQLPPNPYISLNLLSAEIRPSQWHVDPKYVDMVLNKVYEMTDEYSLLRGRLLPNQTIIIPLDLSGDWKTFACQEIIKYMPVEK